MESILMKAASVVLLICMLLVTAGCEKAALPRGMVELLRIVPRDVDVLAVAHVEKLKESFLYDLWKERGDGWDKIERDLQTFQEETGVDPRRDVEIAMFSAADGLRAPIFAALLIRGAFDREEIEGHLKEAGLEGEEYEGYRVYSTLRGNPAMGFLDDHTVVLGTAGSVRTTVDLKRGEGESFAEAPERMALVEGLAYRDQLWCLSEVNDTSRKIAGKVLGKVQGEFDLGNIVDAIRQVAFCVDVRASVNVSLQGICVEENDADLLARALRGFVAFGKVGAEEDGELMKLLDAIQIRSHKRIVAATASVSRETIERLEERTIEKLNL